MENKTKRKRPDMIGNKNTLGLKHTEEWKEEAKKRMTGSKNHLWKGNKVGYVGLHHWLYRWLGKANHCEVCGKNDKRMYHWCNIDHQYRRVLDDYIPMCVPCHRKYDYSKFKK